jgi:hypothetical protein
MIFEGGNDRCDENMEQQYTDLFLTGNFDCRDTHGLIAAGTLPGVSLLLKFIISCRAL